MSAGLVLGGRYRLVSRLGEGGYGSVWSGHDSRLGRNVAVKLLHAGVDVPRFQREAHALAQLSHPNIVAAYDFGIDGAAAYLVLELITGRTIGEELAAARAARLVGLPLDRVLHIADQVLAGLGAAHSAGLVHRDLKPANIMGVASGPEVKIVDFGIARNWEASRMTAVGSVLGTLPYMAPEQFDDAQLDGRVDLYSLGCVMHELLTGVSPYQAKNTAGWIKAHHMQPPGHVRDRRPELPPAVDAFVQHLLAKDPNGRPANAAAARALVAALPRNPTAAQPPVAGQPAAGAPPVAVQPPAAVPPPGWVGGAGAAAGGSPQPHAGGSRMAIVCRKCGHRNPEGTQFCTRPGCGEYLDWGTQVRTGAVSGTAAVPVGMYTQKSAASIRLSTSDLTVVPGAAVTATATVHNGGTQIEEFTVSVAGQAAAWATVDPPTMRVFPGAEGECVVRFAPPRHSSSVAGKAAFSVTASSSVHRSLVASAQGTLEVGVFRELRASLVPLQTRGRGRTVHTVEVANDGNTTEAVKLTATDPAAAVRFVVPAADVAIRPGSMTIPVPVTPPRQWFGRPRHHQFQVTVTAANRLVPVSGHATPPPATPPAVRLDGTRESVPLIPAWVTRLAALLLVIGVGAVATMAATHTGPFKNAAATIPPSQSPTPSTAPPTTQPPQSPSTAPSSPTVAPGDALLQAAHNAEGTTLDFHLVMRKPSDLAGTVLDGQYQAGVGVAYSGPALNGTGTLSNQYVSTGNDFYIQCGPTVDPSQCPVHVDMTRQLSDQGSGYLFIADPLFAFQLLETATSVTGGPGTYSGTCDLSKINGTLSASTQLASYLLNQNYPRHLQFQATTDGDNRLTGFQTKFDDHQGNVLNYALTLTGFGGTVVVTLPTSSVEADPTWYAN